MKRQLCLCAVLAGSVVFLSNPVMAYFVTDGFETGWAGTHADNYENLGYKFGSPSPSTQMTQTTDYVHTGSYAAKLEVTSAGVSPGANWWGAVSRTFDHNAMKKEYNPWVSVWYYDAVASALPSGYLSVIPNTPVPYMSERADIQIGTRWGQISKYWHVSGNGLVDPPTWVQTSIDRTEGWHEFKLVMSSAGGAEYFIDGTSVGFSPRTDYLDIEYISLGSFYLDDYPSDSAVYYDDLSFGSDYIPEPTTMILFGLSIVGLVRRKLRK